MQAPAKMPFAVLRSIILHARRSRRDPREVAAEVKWDSLNGCYCFGFAGMYVGIETDGYMHT